MDNNKNERYTYLSAGFNRFLNRSINSTQSTTLSEITSSSPRREINFDQMQTSGSVGDKIQAGGIIIDGRNRRIVIVDELKNEVGWIGNIDNQET